MSAQDKTGAPSGVSQVLTIKLDASAIDDKISGIMSQVSEWAAEHDRRVHELDVALNGEVGAVRGAGTNARLGQLVAQVRSRQGVQVVNMADTMRINFQAPDGRRATLFLGPLLDAMDSNGQVDFEPGIAGVMRAAIAAYPCAGEPLPLAPVAADECAAHHEGHRFGAHGPAGETQCEWCGVKP